jgi:hypothetical protein
LLLRWNGNCVFCQLTSTLLELFLMY